MTTKLSDTQRQILAAACERKSGALFPIAAAGLKGGAVTMVLKGLLKQELVREKPARSKDNVWRNDEEGGAVTLVVTPKAREALGLENPNAKAAKKAEGATRSELRANTKQALLIEMLRRPEGATIEQIMAATGWLPHTVRGALAGALKKRLGLTITSEKAEGQARVYRTPN